MISLKAFLAAVAVLAVAVGLMLPVPHRDTGANSRSQIETMHVGG